MMRDQFFSRNIQMERNLQDDQIRLRTAQASAERNGARGQYEMATRYRHGWGVPQNAAMAINLYQQAADRKQDAHAGACYELVRLYLQGNVYMRVEKDLNKAEYFARLGANADPYAYEYSEYLGSATSSYNQEGYIQQCKELLPVIQTLKENETFFMPGPF